MLGCPGLGPPGPMPGLCPPMPGCDDGPMGMFPGCEEGPIGTFPLNGVPGFEPCGLPDPGPVGIVMPEEETGIGPPGPIPDIDIMPGPIGPDIEDIGMFDMEDIGIGPDMDDIGIGPLGPIPIGGPIWPP